VLVSGLAYPGSIPGRIVGAWRNGAVDAVLSRYNLAELVRGLPRLNHRLRLSEEDVLDLVDALALLADLVDPVPDAGPDAGPVAPMLLRDPADLPVLGTLLASGADYLVTGDKDLLALADRHSILTPVPFWTRHGQ
jgi:putative PIN family toxin of toxin-antitoxin system